MSWAPVSVSMTVRLPNGRTANISPAGDLAVASSVAGRRAHGGPARRPPELVQRRPRPSGYLYARASRRRPCCPSPTRSRVGSRRMSTDLGADRPGCAGSARRRVGGVDDRLDVGARRDAEGLGEAGRAAGPGDVAALDHQLQDRVRRAGVDALGDEDVADHQVRHPVGVAGDRSRRPSCPARSSAMSTIGPSHGDARGVARRVDARRPCPRGSRTIWTLTPSAPEPLGLGLDARRSPAGTSAPRWRPRDTSSGVVSSSAPMTPTLIPLTLNTTDGVDPRGRLAGRGLDDVGGQEREVGPLPGAASSRVDPVVELVVAVRRRVEAPGVLDVDRRHVLEQRRVRRRGADVVAAGEDQARARAAPASSSSNSVAELRGAADRDVDARRSSVRRRVELAVEVVEADDRDRLGRRRRP